MAGLVSLKIVTAICVEGVEGQKSDIGVAGEDDMAETEK